MLEGGGATRTKNGNLLHTHTHTHIHIPAGLVLISESVTGADSAICVVTSRLPTCGSSWVGTVTVEVVDSVDPCVVWLSMELFGRVWTAVTILSQEMEASLPELWPVCVCVCVCIIY